MKSKFDIEHLGNTYIEIISLGSKLIDSIGPDIVTYKTKAELLYNILKQIYPINKNLKFTDESIDKACEKILLKLDLLNKDGGEVFVTDTNGNKIEFNLPEETRSKTDIFCKDVLRLDFLPYQKYTYLQETVDKDLMNISNLIINYEKNNYIKSKEKPRNHKERMYYDFYQRCLNERINILNYKLYELIPSAIRQSHGSHGLLENMGFIISHMDVPYQFGRSFNDRYFDISKMDLVSHRIGDFYANQAPYLTECYRSDKQKFYRIYFKHKPLTQCFSDIKSYLNKLEILKKRIIILDEMELLFRARKWIGFYAIALPQIEGLFSEMCSLLFPNNSNYASALPDKVQKVRPYYSLEKVYFDYFQYFIPIQRNKFTHSGYDDNFKLKSYDLLTDILFLVQTIFELENPIIKLINIIDGKKKHYFSRIEDYIEYFNMITDIKKDQKQENRNDVLLKTAEFEKNTLSKMPKTEEICNYVISNLESLLIKFNHLNIDFNEIGSLLKDNNRLQEVKQMYKTNYYYLPELKKYQIFLLLGVKYLPNIKKEYLFKLNELQIKYNKILANIVHLEKIIAKN